MGKCFPQHPKVEYISGAVATSSHGFVVGDCSSADEGRIVAFDLVGSESPSIFAEALFLDGAGLVGLSSGSRVGWAVLGSEVGSFAPSSGTGESLIGGDASEVGVIDTLSTGASASIFGSVLL